MSHRGILKSALMRGGLVTAANWPVVVIQFVAESAFKVLLAIPIIGGALLVAVVLRRDLADLLRGDLRDILAAVANGLLAQPAALGAFLFAFLLVLLGGSAFMFLVKGGTVAVLAHADATTGPVEHPPIQWDAFIEAARFSVDLFRAGSARLFRRYLGLGLALMAAYALSGVIYLLVLYVGYQVGSNGALLLGWTVIAAILSSALIVWITVVNLLYLLTQIVLAISNQGVAAAFGNVLRFLRAELWDVIGVFTVILVLVVLATGASIAATAGLGLIAFAPLAGLAVLPLQLAAWLVRNLVFQYLGLTALAAYLHLYRTRGPSAVEAAPSRPSGKRPHSLTDHRS
jgi:hypothetical protein